MNQKQNIWTFMQEDTNGSFELGFNTIRQTVLESQPLQCDYANFNFDCWRQIIVFFFLECLTWPGAWNKCRGNIQYD